MADNTVLSAAVGTGDTVRDLEDASTVKWPVGVVCYATTVSAGANVLQVVQLTAGLPVQPQTGSTWAISAASLPLPTGAATESTLSAINTKLPALGQALAGSSVPVVLTATQLASLLPFSTVAATQSGVWTVGISAAQTIAVTNAGAFAVQATLAAGSAVIGHVIVDSGTVAVSNTTFASTQSGSWTVAVSNTTFAVTNAGTFAVQASAGTNLNTSALALEAGNLATLAGAVSSANFQTNIAKVGGSAFSLGQQLAAAALPVVLTASQLTTLTPPATVNVSITGAGNVNATQAGTWNIATLTGITNNVNVAQAGSWTILPGNTPNTTPWLANPKDPAATTGSITAVDAGTSTATNSLGQSITTGNPTANSSVSCTLTGQGTVVLQFKNSGANTCTFALERSTDGGTTYLPMSMEQVAVGGAVSSVTTTDANANVLRANVSGMTTVRIRCTAYTSGTVTVNWQPSYEPAQIPVNQGAGGVLTNPWPVQLIPATSGGLNFGQWVSGTNTNNTVVKASAGQLYEIVAASICTSVLYLKLYNQATAPVAGVNTPLWTLPIPASSNAAGLAKTIPEGLNFSTGIAFTLTLGIAATDNTCTVVNTAVVNLGWK